MWECVKERNFDTSKFAKYTNYIQSKEWKIKRNQALIRDNNLCQRCKVKPAEEVHHLTYENLFCEKLEDLLSLCKVCHIETHEQLDNEKTLEIRNKINENKAKD
ncbi:MAG: HNH endonuclease [Flavobacterium sp.]|nr:HNH endonuclease [Flavobacterium sp.]